MAEIMHANTIAQYNQWAGAETQHPLVGFIDFSQVGPLRHMRKLYGFYAVFLKNVKCGELRYGRHYYDYQDGSMLFIAPGQVFGAEDDGVTFQPDGYILMFHSDLLRRTPLAQKMQEYTFFSYTENEALHLSADERRTIMECFQKIQTELSHPVDKYSKHLITDNIKLFLDYCARFYDRQFITREVVCHDLLTRFERMLDDYITSGLAKEKGFPTVQYCADSLKLSAGYLSDLLKKETGLTAQRVIHDKLIDHAKTQIASTNLTINEISYNLGFQYSQHFTRLFKRMEGISPKEYRLQLQS